MRSNCCSAGTDCGNNAVMLARPLRKAFSATSCTARAFTSTAHIVAPGEFAASDKAIAPEPHPRSRKLPEIGGRGAASSRI
jgi:hypothetical protein